MSVTCAAFKSAGADGVAREEQLIVDFVQSATGCDRPYVGRSLADAHRGMGLAAKESTFCVPR
jgi:hypothetical protein